MIASQDTTAISQQHRPHEPMQVDGGQKCEASATARMPINYYQVGQPRAVRVWSPSTERASRDICQIPCPAGRRHESGFQKCRFVKRMRPRQERT